MKSTVVCIALMLVASTVGPAAAARGGQRSLQEKGKGTHFLVGLMDHFSKSHHDSYSNPTIVAAQPTVVYAPMPQLTPTIIASQPQEPEEPVPVKSKSASITFGDKKIGKTATFTFTKTVPDHSKVLEHLGLGDMGEEPAPAPTPVPIPNPVPVPIPNPVPVPIPNPVPIQPYPQPTPQNIIAAQPQLQYVVTPGQQVQFVAAQPQVLPTGPQVMPGQPQILPTGPQIQQPQILPTGPQFQQPQQMAYAGSYVASQPQGMPTYVQPAAPVMMPAQNTWGK